ncbi:MAG: apolipoprotein N-acyltransferase [Candidatus Dadabacteria bacterium]|nr:apolipoprotein N-acyltransferase [Candidatus Dadabacteria bacterium]NIS08932.1 apolipoprotein N-acyltransferase [Candidatus Dadabacteria bacterium]NIV40834.1 apolipoprotein N-acyltransferase [Candidatus Dadabacteria bacterium]NIX15482.1 apolipoprotein N-acyltransferase [Candidatus Dadabacteria bacterium]NIY22803.1 apolipoprotein N-acyltransferase [Candidatus Dadabacteria bacterium]
MRDLNKKQFTLCTVSAALLALPFFLDFAWPLLFISFVALFICIENETPKKAFKIGTLIGTMAYFATTYWLIGTISRFGGFPVFIAVFFQLIISFYSGLMFGIFAALISSLILNRYKLISTFLIGIIWVAVEYFYPLLFPFGIASPLANFHPIIQVSDLFGIGFLSFLAIIVNHSLYKTLRNYKHKSKMPIAELSLSACLMAAVLVYGYFKIDSVSEFINQSPKLKVGIVQGNFDFMAKKQDNYLHMVNKHKELSYTFSDADLIIWPETAIQLFIPTTFEYLAHENTQLIPFIRDKYFLTGGLSFDLPKPGEDIENVNKYNSAFLTDARGKILGRFHKIKLLLFGEYLPFSKYFPSLKQLSPATGDYVPGSELNLMKIDKLGVKIAPLICYEDIIPSFSRQFKEKGANLLINLTNDAWFGKTIAAHQHLLLSVPRTVENRTYLIRATNTGVSAIIDPLGRVLKESDIFVQQTLSGEVRLLDHGNTFYVNYGYYFYSLCLIITIFYLVAIFKMRRR